MPKKRQAQNLDGQAKPVTDNRAYDAALAWPDSPQERAAREQRLNALCEKHGVPVDLEPVLRSQLLIKVMGREHPMWQMPASSGTANVQAEVTMGHGRDCVCEICYPKRVKTDLKFSTVRLRGHK